MFTGLVEDVGRIVAIAPEGRGKRLDVRTKLPIGEFAIGDSVANNGVCLTVERATGDVLSFVAGAETLDKTTLGALKIGEGVHLERALRLGDRLGGHWVAGHVDGVGVVHRVIDAAESIVYWIEVPPELSRYIATKGSVCLDGVSLTVNEVDGERFRVNIVPHTRAVTRFGGLRAGSALNVEVDVVARYLERLLQAGAPAPAGLTLDKLQQHGFLP